MFILDVRPCRVALALVPALLAGLSVMPATSALAAPRVKRATHATHHHPRHHPPKLRLVKVPGAPSVQAPANCQDTELVPAPGNLPLIASATLCLINNQRAAQGLTPLRNNAALAAAATNQSLDMVASNYFDHVSPSGPGLVERLRASGYLTQDAGFNIGENIAAATGSLATPAATVQSWMNSPEHRANILTAAYQETGIGVAAAVPATVATDPGATYTEDFGATT